METVKTTPGDPNLEGDVPVLAETKGDGGAFRAGLGAAISAGVQNSSGTDRDWHRCASRAARIYVNRYFRSRGWPEPVFSGRS